MHIHVRGYDANASEPSTLSLKHVYPTGKMTIFTYIAAADSLTERCIYMFRAMMLTHQSSDRKGDHWIFTLFDWML